MTICAAGVVFQVKGTFSCCQGRRTCRVPLWCGTVRWQGDTQGSQRGPARLLSEWSVADEIVTGAQSGSWADTRWHCQESKCWDFSQHRQPACTAHRTYRNPCVNQMATPPIHCVIAKTAVRFRTCHGASPAVPKHMVLSKTAKKEEVLCLWHNNWKIAGFSDTGLFLGLSQRLSCFVFLEPLNKMTIDSFCPVRNHMHGWFSENNCLSKGSQGCWTPRNAFNGISF